MGVEMYNGHRADAFLSGSNLSQIGTSGPRALERRRARCLSSQLPAGIRCQPHRRLRLRHRQEIVRRAAAGERLRQRCRSDLQAGRVTQRRPHRHDRVETDRHMGGTAKTIRLALLSLDHHVCNRVASVLGLESCVQFRLLEIQIRKTQIRRHVETAA